MLVTGAGVAAQPAVSRFADCDAHAVRWILGARRRRWRALCPHHPSKETAVYAIVRAGSKQQKVAVGDVIEIDKTDAAVGDTLTLPVVMTVDGDQVTATGLDKAGVTVEVLGATKGPKIIIQKYKNKTGYKKRQGHRQKYTQVKVTDSKA
jgi:large subunit ribosomal protein L21